MPYVITTKQRSESYATGHSYVPNAIETVVSRRAVATLDEAREQYLYNAVAGFHGQPWLDRVDDIPESGGSIGPLPDGTVIEVEPVTWRELRAALRTRCDHHDSLHGRCAACGMTWEQQRKLPEYAPCIDVLAAYNAAQEARA